jgi:hypothetical protein
VNSKFVRGPLEFTIHLSLVLLKNLRLDIPTIRSDSNVNCTHLEVECELVFAVAIIFRVLA